MSKTSWPNTLNTSLSPKKVPISPGVAFKAEDAPELPDPLKQKYYRSFVANLQFAATWVRFDISFAVSQLARYCASAGHSSMGGAPPSDEISV